MTEQTTTGQESVQTPAVSLSDMSLAEYRAQREKPAATPRDEPAPLSEAKTQEEKKRPEAKTPSAGQPVADRRDGESDADQGAADYTESDASGESAGDDDKPNDEPASPSEAKAQRKKGGFQRKIEAKDREIAELRRQLADKSTAAPANSDGYGNGKKETPAAAQQQPSAPELPKFEDSKPKPKLEDFDSIESYTEALTDWKLEKSTFDQEQKQRAAKAQSEAKQVLDSWNQRKTEAQQRHEDYDEVLDSVSDVKLSRDHQRIFLESEHGPELAYQLASDREQLQKFATMTPLAAARFLGKLEAALPASMTPQAETKGSNAPRPIKPLSGSRASGTPDVSKMSLADWRRAREAGKV